MNGPRYDFVSNGIVDCSEFAAKRMRRILKGVSGLEHIHLTFKKKARTAKVAKVMNGDDHVSVIPVGLESAFISQCLVDAYSSNLRSEVYRREHHLDFEKRTKGYKLDF